MAIKNRGMKTNDLYNLRLITSNQISPDGKHVIYSLDRVVKKTEKKYSNLWVVPTNGDNGGQFTFGNHVDKMPKWSPDGKKVVFLSNRFDADQDQLFIIHFTGGEARRVTNLKGDFGEFNWSPEGNTIIFQFRRMDEEVVKRMEDEDKKNLGIVSRRITRIRYKQDGEGFLPNERWHLWMVDENTQNSSQLTIHEVFDDLFPVWSPEGDKIAFLSNRSEEPDLDIDASDIYIMNLKDESIFGLGTPPGRKGYLSYSPDGCYIAYFGIDGWGEWWKNISLFVASTDGSGDVKDLLQDQDMYIDADTCSDTLEFSPTAPVWSSNGSEIYFQVVEAGNVVLKAVSVETKVVHDVITETGVVGDFSIDKETSRIAYNSASLNYPCDIKLFDLSKKSINRLTKVNCFWLDKVSLGDVEAVWFKGYDGNDLQGWIVKPFDFDPDVQYPAILWIHGGPISMFAHQFSHEYQYFAEEGYISFYANPRGGTGYGQAHMQAIWNNWGTKDYKDLTAWTDYVAALPFIDEKRLGVTGGSYGGYMTAWIIGHTDRFKAAVANAMYNNLISGWGSSDYNWGTQLEYDNKPPWEDFDNLWRQSPMKYIGNAMTPTIIMHGEDDMRDALEQSEQIYVALKYLGVKSELILFPGESHGVSRIDRKIEKLNHMLRWFNRYLKISDE